MKISKAGDPLAVTEPAKIIELRQFEYIEGLKTSNLNYYHVRPKCAVETMNETASPTNT